MKEKFHYYLTMIIMLATAVIFQPARADSFQDTTTVISAAPHMVQSYQPVCRMEEVQVPRQQRSQQDRGYAGGAMGGVAGALLGSQVGGGSGNKVATAAGAVTGAITGDRMQNGSDPDRGIMGAALGGGAGALLGSQLGGGNGNKMAIALGAVLGAAVGDNVQNGQQANAQNHEPAMETRVQQICEQQAQMVKQGYDVTYEYDGRNRTTWMQRDPGRYVTLDISVR